MQPVVYYMYVQSVLSYVSNLFLRTIPDDEPWRIRVMSWNIDGLDPRNLQSRTLGVCETINK